MFPRSLNNASRVLRRGFQTSARSSSALASVAAPRRFAVSQAPSALASGNRFQQQCRSFAADVAGNPVHKQIDDLVKEHDVFLFMKGNPIFPQCGFSRMVCEVLKREGLEGKFQSLNVLDGANQDLREGVKEYADWPTIPQLYIKGEFVGGCDIVVEMHRDGELKKMLSEVKKE